MAKDELYQRIIEDYKITGSVKRTAENLGTTLVRAQRVLITEGLWSSDTSEEIWRLYQKGLNVKEIAEKLFITEKTVQAYLPYTKGYYSDTIKSDEALRSSEYRGRKQSAANSRVHYVQNGEKMKEVKFYTAMKDGMRPIELPERHVVKEPSVFQLHLELDLGRPNEDNREILRKYGKALQGISRDIFVRGDMTLHALHYAIQRAFGWENSHLHRFSFTTDTFNMLTGGKQKDDPHKTWTENYDGSLRMWTELVGTYFRFPTEDMDDLYWDDDYNGEVSIKSWLRRKYTRNYYYGGDSEHFVIARRSAIRYAWENKDLIESGITIAEAGAKGILEQEPNELLERLKIEEVLYPIGVKDPDGSLLDEQIETREELFKKANAKYDEDGFPKVVRKSYRVYDEMPWVEDDKRVLPVTNNLVYSYDYGDGWEVKITCTDGFYINDRYDDNPGGLVVGLLDDKRAMEEMRIYNIRDERIEGEQAADIAKVMVYSKPECIAVDGLPVMDDVGGPYGYINFLQELHEGEPDEREENKTWARGMGWTGRMPKAKSVL
ncbi:MAG: hypothetical protein IKO10_11160 [Lachnospiraceae bacterium]|nr:hypothetical protein [Lachnospiraceae bacterium]